MGKLETMQEFLEKVVSVEYDKYLIEKGYQDSEELADAFFTGYTTGMLKISKLIEQKTLVLKGE